MSYAQNKEIVLFDQFPAINNYPLVIANWLAGLPPIVHQDSNLDSIIVHNNSEVAEAALEREKVGTPEYDSQAHIMEVMDALWLPTSHALAAGILPDFLMDARTRVNGLGKRSDSYEKLAEISGNMTPRSVERDLVYYAELWLSVVADLPEIVDIEKMIALVAEKNHRNYPSVAFSIGGAHEGMIFDHDVLQLSFDHPRRVLRLIRDFQVKVLGRKDREKGLRKEDFMPYLDYILAHQQSADIQLAVDLADIAYNQLNERLYRDNNLPVGNELLRKRKIAF